MSRESITQLRVPESCDLPPISGPFQMLGGEEFPTEAWAAHAAGRERRANDADGPFSATAFATL
jgi:hypothetical protein